MPELPDLEIFSENLKDKILNKKIVDVEVIKNKPLGGVKISDFKNKLVNKKITNIARVGKQLLFTLNKKDKLYLHLMLHGELYYQKEGENLPPFTCVIFKFNDNTELIFSDKTQWMRLSLEVVEEFGIDPISNEFTVDKFKEIIEKSGKKNIKVFLTDQSIIGGIGNAYADEILWYAKISPKRKISELNLEEIKELHNAIIYVLKDAIKKVRIGLKGGITGEYREFVKVHGKKGQRCTRCDKIIIQEKVAGKPAEYCPGCQK